MPESDDQIRPSATSSGDAEEQKYADEMSDLVKAFRLLKQINDNALAAKRPPRTLKNILRENAGKTESDLLEKDSATYSLSDMKRFFSVGTFEEVKAALSNFQTRMEEANAQFERDHPEAFHWKRPSRGMMAQTTPEYEYKKKEKLKQVEESMKEAAKNQPGYAVRKPE